MTDDIVLTIDGMVYCGWTQMRVERAITQFASTFEIAVSERWLGRSNPWPIQPWSCCQVFIGGDLVLTGYVDCYNPSYSATAHTVRIAGRSKTADLVDCTPEINGGQYNGWKLDAIARGICAKFGINVVVQTDVGDPFPDATLDRCETAYEFLERLCRLRSVFACDDPFGNLVLTTAGSQPSAGALVEGENILNASAILSVAKRFSKYIVRNQHGLTSDCDGEVLVDIEGVAYDNGCPRYRPHSVMGESMLTPDLAQKRAMWQAIVSTARGTQAQITVPGFRQPDGSLWQINQMVPVRSPMLGLDRVLLTASVAFDLTNDGGQRTHFSLGPVEGYTPDPAQVRLHKGKGAGADRWADVNGISANQGKKE